MSKNAMLIIADSGSTKTTWSILNQNSEDHQTCITAGINPMHQDEAGILNSLKSEFSVNVGTNPHVFFYGAGCISSEVNATVLNALEAFFGKGTYHVDSDLMAAARSLCQHEKGIACILGTGSNSCYYDGKAISKHISPLGYILGDEGSGAVLGRKLLSDVLKNQLPDQIRQRFFDSYAITPQQIIESVYKKPFPSRFLASFTHFIHRNLNEPAIRNIVKESFLEFFTKNVLQYPESAVLPVHFTGGIAFYFSEILAEAAMQSGCKPGNITASPMEGLVQYHLNSTD